MLMVMEVSTQEKLLTSPVQIIREHAGGSQNPRNCIHNTISLLTAVEAGQCKTQEPTESVSAQDLLPATQMNLLAGSWHSGRVWGRS